MAPHRIHHSPGLPIPYRDCAVARLGRSEAGSYRAPRTGTQSQRTAAHERPRGCGLPRAWSLHDGGGPHRSRGASGHPDASSPGGPCCAAPSITSAMRDRRGCADAGRRLSPSLWRRVVHDSDGSPSRSVPRRRVRTTPSKWRRDSAAPVPGALVPAQRRHQGGTGIARVLIDHELLRATAPTAGDVRPISSFTLRTAAGAVLRSEIRCRDAARRQSAERRPGAPSSHL